MDPGLVERCLVGHARGVGDVSVSLLGGFTAAVDDVPVPEKAWRLKKARELVKLLALAPGHRLHREQVMDVLWRDRAPDAAANNLHQAVYVARRALDRNAIVIREDLLHLAADVDVDRLELAAVDARRARTPAAYRAALSLYGGELLPENRYDDWAEGRRDELSELAAELADGAAFGSADAARLPALPVDASSFVGRERELAELKALLRGTRLLTLAGTGGVGKTRLALELARSAERSYPGGAALVELAALEDARLVVEPVAAALDVRALPGQKLIDAVVDFLGPRSALLVVDNCEHLLAATAGLADTLLRSAPQLTILATSREPLSVPGEVVFRVPSLDIPDPEHALEPRELLRYEAVRLFVERADAASGFALDEENAADVARICSRLDGLPLALELAAGRLGALGAAAIAERLDDRFRVLRSVSHAAPTRQQTLKATLQWSHDLLEADERTLFRQLAVFAGGFELGAVERVCACGELDRSGIADVLARLVEKSLVAAEGGSSRERRYRLLETVRVYARERLDEAGETDALAVRQANWALALGRGAARLAPARPRRREPARRPGHVARARPGRRAAFVRGAVAVLAAPDRPSRGAAALRQGTRRRPGAHGSPGAGAARRGGDRLPQRRAVPGATVGRRELCRSHRRSATRALSGGRFSSWESSVSRATRPMSRCRGSSERSNSRGVRASPRLRRSACTHSGLLTGYWGIWPAPRSSWTRASSCSARSLARLSGSCLRSTSRRSGRARAATSRGCAWCSRTRCNRSWRSPAMPLSSYALGKPGWNRQRARRPCASARAARRERGTVRGLGRRARPGGGARPARVPRARRGRSRGGPRALSSRRSSCVAGRVIGAVSGSCSRGSV